MVLLNLDINLFADLVPDDAEIDKKTFIQRVKSRYGDQGLVRFLSSLVFYRISKTRDGDVLVN